MAPAPCPNGALAASLADANETHDSLHVLQMDVQTLTVVVRSDDKLEDLLESKVRRPAGARGEGGKGVSFSLLF